MSMTTPIERATQIVADVELGMKVRDQKMDGGWSEFVRVPIGDDAAGKIVAALVAAGLLATEQEWGIGSPRAPGLHRGPWTKSEAEAWIAEGIEDGILPDVFVIATRSTTPWEGIS